MKRFRTIALAIILGILILFLATGCTDAMVVNDNISKDADNFKIYRHIVFVNNMKV